MTSPTSKHLKVKDQIWWHGVNISEKLKVIAAEHPVEPLARRQPQWQSVSSFFTRAALDLASEQPGKAEARTPLRHSCTSRLPLGRTPSKCTLGGRPKSAAGSKARELGRHRKEAPPAIRRRPQSAPALLRNDEPGLIAKKTHKDPLRQHVEDLAVHERMEWLKREGHTKRELIAKVDVLADPILFDLKVLHNSAARAKTAPHGQLCATPSKASKAGASSAKDCAERLRGLSRSLANDTQQHCARLQIPHRVMEGGKMRRLFDKLKDIEEITSDPADAPKAEFHHGNDMALKVKPEIGGSFAEQLKGLWGNAAGVSPGDLSHPLVRLAYFLNGHHPRRLRMVLEAFDCACKGSINQEDFCTGLELMSYQSISEYKELFFMLDSEGRKELDVGWLEDHLKRLIDADDEPG